MGPLPCRRWTYIADTCLECDTADLRHAFLVYNEKKGVGGSTLVGLFEQESRAYCDVVLGHVAHKREHRKAAVLDLLQPHRITVHAHRIEGGHVQ